MTSKAINKHTFTPGTGVNLVPGAIAINKTDETLHLRAEGRVATISLAKWQSGLAPRDGAQDGAPLVMGALAPAWDAQRAPASVVNGVIAVDAPPSTGEYGVPGVQINDLDSDVALIANAVIAERFYVASDQIKIDKLAFRLRAQTTPGPISIGIADDLGLVRALVTIASPSTTALNAANFATTLQRGFYQFVLWTQEAGSFGAVAGTVTEQGWSLDGSQNPVFTYRSLGNGDMSTTFSLAAAGMAAQNRPDPGASKVLLAGWSDL